MERLVIASGNKGKLKEIKEILGGLFEVVSMAELGFNEDIDETGSTFFENALIKAKAVAMALNENVLADDSGLMVESLNGDPGVHSARYSGEHGNDENNRKLLLKNLENKENRRAKFVSSVVLYRKDGSYIDGYGETHGSILFEETGTNGFGYDCLFLSDDLKKSFGVATAEEKNLISHRFRAIQDLYQKLQNK